MDEHEVDVTRNQNVFQPCQSFQLWLVFDGQLVVLAQRRHPVVFKVSEAGLAQPKSLLPIYLHLDILKRGIPYAVIDDVPVLGSRFLRLSNLVNIF